MPTFPGFDVPDEIVDRIYERACVGGTLYGSAWRLKASIGSLFGMAWASIAQGTDRLIVADQFRRIAVEGFRQVAEANPHNQETLGALGERLADAIAEELTR